MKNNKILWLVVIILLAIGAFFWLHNSGGSLGSLSYQSSSPSPSATGSPKTTVKSSPKATSSVTAAKTYTQLVQEYVNRTLQFNSLCQVTPSSMVLKNNTSILLDNRANVARTVSVDGKSYNLSAYGYQVVTLSSKTLPHTVAVNCGSTVNAGQVLLQANISGE